MKYTCLVTGSKGHLGQHVVKELRKYNYTVKAGLRQPANIPAENNGIEYHYADMLNRDSILKAMEGVDILIHCAAVFKHWAKDPYKEIVEANIEGTRIVLEAAAELGIKKVIYISSVAAVGHVNKHYLNEEHWNHAPSNPYYHSKIKSEKLAWQLSKELKLDMVSILPSAMVGPIDGRLTDTMNYLHLIFTQRLPINPSFHFNFVDVRDVAKAVVSSIRYGKPGERYIVSNKECSNMSEILEASEKANLKLKSPIKLPKVLLWLIALMAELQAKLSSKPAELTRSQVKLFYRVKQNYDHSKASEDLNFKPRSARQAIMETFKFFENQRLTDA